MRQDKDRCQCFQLTLKGVQAWQPDIDQTKLGYEYMRLGDYVASGIYECNSRCKCSATCLNRVVQKPLQTKLQVFKTGNRGWGLRCLNDVPMGAFVCVYAGDMLNEQMANQAGDEYGDEYFAELDYIEVVESLKEGYERSVKPDPKFDGVQPAEEAASGNSESESDSNSDDADKDDSADEEFVAVKLTNMTARQTQYNTRRRMTIDGTKGFGKAAEASRPKSCAPRLPPKRPRTVRKLFGRNECVYIMDAKKTGNVGRYFNVSDQSVTFAK